MAEYDDELTETSHGGAPTEEELKRLGDKYGNDPRLEMVWATKAYAFAETHWKLLQVCGDPKRLRLTAIDREIYADFKATFPEEAVRVRFFSDRRIKSKEAKARWRPFLMKYKNKVQSFNYLTLLRVDALDPAGYTDANTTVVPRIQFLVYEIARNRKGINGKLLDTLGLLRRKPKVEEDEEEEEEEEVVVEDGGEEEEKKEEEEEKGEEEEEEKKKEEEEEKGEEEEEEKKKEEEEEKKKEEEEEKKEEEEEEKKKKEEEKKEEEKEKKEEEEKKKEEEAGSPPPVSDE